VSYTFSRDFISLLLKDGDVATNFGQTEVLLKGLRRVSQCGLLNVMWQANPAVLTNVKR